MAMIYLDELCAKVPDRETTILFYATSMPLSLELGFDNKRVYIPIKNIADVTDDGKTSQKEIILITDGLHL